MPTWLIPKKGGGGGGSVEGLDDGNPPAAIGWLFDWRRSKNNTDTNTIQKPCCIIHE